MNVNRPVSPDPLRCFLRDHMTEEQLKQVACADYARGAEGIFQEFRRNLDTGEYRYNGDGNPYECTLLQRHDDAGERPLSELFGGWWLGTFCSDPGSIVLIDNLGIGVVPSMVVRGCAGLGADASRAAHAALPFLGFLRERLSPHDLIPLSHAEAALEAVERDGERGVRSGRIRRFLQRESWDEF